MSSRLENLVIRARTLGLPVPNAHLRLSEIAESIVSIPLKAQLTIDRSFPVNHCLTLEARLVSGSSFVSVVQ
jgi:hypothetical protein